MVQIVLEIVQRFYVAQDGFRYLFVILQNLLQSIGTEIVAALQVQELAEREASQVVHLYDAAQFGVFFFQSHHGRTGEHDFQSRKLFIAGTQVMTPFGIFKNLVYQQHFTSSFHKFSGKVHQCVFGEVEVVHVDKQA